MKTITLTLFAAALAIAQNSSSTASTPAKDNKAANTDQGKKQKPATKPAASKAVAQKAPAKAEPPVTAIPAGATQVEPNLYRMTDSNGKTWNYRQTPFGINKWEQTSSPEAAPAPEPVPQSTQGSLRSSQVKTEPITFTDLGDSYRFERSTPFGHNTWVRKKSEVTAKEKAIIEGRDPQSVPDTTGEAGKPAGN